MGVYIWEKKLPSEYQEVEYIQSSGDGTNTGQYIDMGVKMEANSVLGFDIDFEQLNNTTSEREMVGLYYNGADIIRLGFGSGDFINDFTSNHVDTLQNLSWTPNTYAYNTRYHLVVDGNVTRDCPRNIWLFAQNEGANYGYHCISAKLYSCKISKDNSLIRDFIPCYRKQDDEIGLYDLVNNVFYTNQGSGAFTKGQDINYVELELKNAYIGIPDPTSIVLNKSSISLTTVGQTAQLTATIEPTASDKTITWSSDDTTIATVSTTGLVTCVTPGTCTITATTANGLTATCSVGQKEYQEVEWIGSSGSQYINTGFTPTVNTSIVTSLSLGSNSGWAVFFGVTGNDSSNDGVLGRIYSDTSGSFNPWFCNANYDETIAYISTDVFHDIELSANTLYIDGNSYTITTTGTPYQSSMDLFAGNNGGSHGWRKSSCKIKSFTIEDNGNTVRDFIPCYRIADEVIGMYDVVNDVFYTNQGSGTFTKGSDV